MKFNLKKVEESLQMLEEIKYKRLIEIVAQLSNEKCKMKPNILPSQGGIYAFWWTGDVNLLLDKNVNKNIEFKGPNGRKVIIEITDEWIENIKTGNKIPLYIGKTADSIHKRISLHLQLGTIRGLSRGNKALIEKRLTTSNQLRDRIERMFLDEDDIRSLILENIGLSYVLLDGDEECVNRFYLENKAIGHYYPLFNVDIER